MTQIDSTLEGDVVVGSCAVSNDDQLLVVTAAATHPLVEGDFTTGLVHDLGQSRVVLFGEVGLARVRSPQQPADLHPAASGVRKDPADLRVWSGKELVPVALPIREQHTIVTGERRQRVVQATKVRAPVDQHLDAIAVGPSDFVTVPTVDRGRRVPPLGRREEPVIETQRPTFAVRPDDLRSRR